MKNLPKYPGLHNRNGTYYHRAAVPLDIQDSFGKKQVWRSLRTKDHKEALKLVRVAAVEADRLFDEHRAKMAVEAASLTQVLTEEQIKQFGEMAYHSWLYFDDFLREQGFGQASGRSEKDVAEIFEAYRSGIEARMRMHKSHFARGQVRPIDEEIALDFLKDHMGIKLDPASPSLRMAVIENQKAAIRAQKAIAARAEGEVIETPAAPVVSSMSSSQQANGSSVPLLSVAVEEWASEKTKTNWVAKTEREHRVWMAHFIETVGDRPIDDYAKADARAFRNVLMKTPANWNKLPPLSNIPTLSKAAEKAHSLNLPPMSDSNINKLLGFVGAFWTWAEGIYDEVPSGLFKGLKLKINKNVREERDPFDKAELNAIFDAPLYTGCLSLRSWKKEGDLIPKDAGIYWVHLISLFSGMRMGEIIQLYTEDLREEEGALYFDVNANGDDKKLKTATSWRSIPVHPRLIEMGFMELVKARRISKEKRLFPDLKMGDDGYYSSPFSKRFNRFLKSVGVKKLKNAFHSFRHNFEDACRDCDITKEVIDTLQGHGERGMSARYGKGRTLRKLNEAMRRIEYRDLDLTHLNT